MLFKKEPGRIMRDQFQRRTHCGKGGAENEVSGVFAEHFYKRLREGILIFIAAIAVFIMIALVSYHPTIPVGPIWAGQRL